MSLCPACSQDGNAPKGNKHAKYLLVFNKPYVNGTGWKDRNSGLDVLRKELQKVGLDLNSDFRICTLWLHDVSKNEDCYAVGRSIVLDEAKGKECVVLVGAEPCEEFTGLYASDVYGLQVDSTVLSAPIIFVIPKPETVFVQGSGLGELRLSIQKLAKILDK